MAKPAQKRAVRKKSSSKEQAPKARIYKWEGTDKQGKRMSGETRASNLHTARAELRRQGINAVKLKRKPTSLLTNRKSKIRAGDIAVFARQLATMMDAGVPLVQAFDIVGRGNDNPAMQDMLLAIKVDIEGGTALAPALAKHPLHFDDLFCNLVAAGEAAGVLEGLLDKIATYKEKTESIKGKIKKAMFYPSAVIVVAVLVVALIMILVIPQFEELFKSFGADLPAFTKMVVALSRWMQDWWILLFIGIIASVFVVSNIWKRSRKFRELVDRAILKIPVIGVIVNKAAIARFARTTSTMFAAGVPMVEALESVAGATGNIIYSNAVLRMREDVATGQSLQLTMKQQDLFPHMVIQMVAIGEESGSLDNMLSKVADFYEEEVDNMVDALSSLLEPMIMVVIGVLVGGLVVAMYLPIFQMAKVVL
jgi:type IV pilus assembly protein PilC